MEVEPPSPSPSDADESQPASLFSRLNSDAVNQISSLLPTPSVLTLAAVSREVSRTFRASVSTLALSKLSLRGSPLLPALAGLCHRYPQLEGLHLAYSGATDIEVAHICSSFSHLTTLSLKG